MAIAESEYKSVIGLADLYIAEVTTDDDTEYVAGTPEKFAPALEASITPTTNSNTQYADDGPYDVITGEGPTTVEMSVTGIPTATYAKILGKAFDAASGRVFDGNGVPPYFALGFRSQKSNGKYIYIWFLKGRFQAPTQEFATKTDAPEPKPATITYTAISTTHKFTTAVGKTESLKRVFGDEDTTSFDATGWFAQVQVPGVAAVDPLALSVSDPVDDAAAVAVDKTITLTFNNKLPAGAVKNVGVIKADGTAVACVNTLDATGKIMTVNPSANLSAASTYIVAINVVDIYGQALNTAINFATA